MVKRQCDPGVNVLVNMGSPECSMMTTAGDYMSQRKIRFHDKGGRVRVVGKHLKCQRSQCSLLSPADSSSGIMHDEEDGQEGFGGRRVNCGGRSRERPSGWRSLQLPAGDERTRRWG